MISNYRVEGHAIVSADDCIADAAGDKPERLNHPADWRRFQEELARAALIVLGRRSHLSEPPRAGRKRLVVSSSVTALERRDDAWWWNPAGAAAEEAFMAAAPGGGLVAVPGGRLVFDLFLALGYDAFHLAHNPAVHLPGGVPVFSACLEGTSAGAVLAAARLYPAQYEILDAAAGVDVTVWRPWPAASAPAVSADSAAVPHIAGSSRSSSAR